MKELLEFDNWASGIVRDSIFEKKDDAIKREIPKQQDIIFQAQRKYPDRDPDQALSLFLADKLDDFDKRDLQQNQVINAQRRENEKLKTNFTALQQELYDIETGSEQTDAEVKRLKQLSGQLKGDIETRRVSSDEIRDVLAQVELLKNKPGMDPKQYDQLKQQVEDFKKTQIDSKEFEKFSGMMKTLSGQEEVSQRNVKDLQNMATQLSAQQQKLEVGKTDLVKQINDLNNRQTELEKKELEQEKNIQVEVEKKVKELRTGAAKRAKLTRKTNRQWKDAIDNRVENIEVSDQKQNAVLSQLSAFDRRPAQPPQDIESLIKNLDPDSWDIDPKILQQYMTDNNTEINNIDDSDNQDKTEDLKENKFMLKEENFRNLYQELPRNEADRIETLKKIRELAKTLLNSFRNSEYFKKFTLDRANVAGKTEDDIIDATTIAFLKIGRQDLLKHLAYKDLEDKIFPVINYYLFRDIKTANWKYINLLRTIRELRGEKDESESLSTTKPLSRQEMADIASSILKRIFGDDIIKMSQDKVDPTIFRVLVNTKYYNTDEPGTKERVLLTYKFNSWTKNFESQIGINRLDAEARWKERMRKEYNLPSNYNFLSSELPSEFGKELDEAANKMVDNIVGEQVARWIK